MGRTLGTLTFPEIVNLAKKENWSGTLTIESEDVCEHVIFKNGEVVGFSSDERKKLIGTILTETGKIGETQLKQALSIQKESGGTKRLGDILIDMGVISRQTLEETIALHQMGVLSDFLSKVTGTLTFEPEATSGL